MQLFSPMAFAFIVYFFLNLATLGFIVFAAPREKISEDLGYEKMYSINYITQGLYICTNIPLNVFAISISENICNTKCTKRWTLHNI